jgi:uncharacterized membrane protein YccC
MFSLKNLTWFGFFVGIAVLISLVFLLNYNLYVMPDALSVTGGSLIGYFFCTWIAWIITKFKMKERRPEFKFFFLSIASIFTLLASFSGIQKLLG